MLIPTVKCIPQFFWRDSDGDGYGDPNIATESCEQPLGYVSNNQDCDDSNFYVNPSAQEICNGIDDNCNGEIDEGIGQIFCRDADGDGYGDPNNWIQSCEAPYGYVSNNLDCDDTKFAQPPCPTAVSHLTITSTTVQYIILNLTTTDIYCAPIDGGLYAYLCRRVQGSTTYMLKVMFNATCETITYYNYDISPDITYEYF